MNDFLILQFLIFDLSSSVFFSSDSGKGVVVVISGSSEYVVTIDNSDVTFESSLFEELSVLSMGFG